MIEILCDQCRQPFDGEEWMMNSTKDILCGECLKLNF